MGKSRSRMNGLKHGLRSELPVATSIEREEDWQAHRGAVIEALAPCGALEALLAERVALCSWRLGRVSLCEVADLEPSPFDLDLGRPKTVPHPSTVDLVTKYERHLSGEMYRALHELERVQARRGGELVPAPAALDVDVAVRSEAGNP